MIDTVARHGFGAIAPWRREVEGGDVVAIARQIREAGLSVSGYCRSSYLPAEGIAERQARFEENRRALADAATLEAKCFVIVAGGLPGASRDIDGARAQVEEGLVRLLAEARALGVPVAIEPLHPMYAADRCCVNTLAQALDLCARLDPDHEGGIGVALDAYHVWWDPDLVAGIGRAGCERRLDAFHICDWLVPTTDLLMDRGMMGDGVIDLAAMRRNVGAAGFAGYAEIEIFSSRWWSIDNEETLRVCVDRLRTL
ncbi:sugar phosphate isomerase/epimerase family protein [Ancylobacter terrae]|uniref:sugar phosphate isomerase/epimerase family protein n=1 Tax=Ancylobacter sp. sgz301288 TaxID=3342077 RepID=UPI00385DA40F